MRLGVIMTAPVSQEEENGLRLYLLMSTCTEGFLDTFHQCNYDRSPTILYNQLHGKKRFKQLF